MLAGVIWLLFSLEQNALARSQQLSNTLATFGSAPAEISAALHAARAEAVYIEQFLEAVPSYLNTHAIDQIITATPHDATFLRLDFTGRHFILTASTADINTAETHRQALAEFFSVTSGGLTLVGDVYVYEFLIVLE